MRSDVRKGADMRRIALAGVGDGSDLLALDDSGAPPYLMTERTLRGSFGEVRLTGHRAVKRRRPGLDSPSQWCEDIRTMREYSHFAEAGR